MAAAEFRKDIEIEPEMPYSYEQLVRLSLQEGKEKEALAELDAAEKYAPQSHNVPTVRGQLLVRMGRKAEGEAELAAAKKLFASPSSGQGF